MAFSGGSKRNHLPSLRYNGWHGQLPKLSIHLYAMFTISSGLSVRSVQIKENLRVEELKNCVHYSG